MNRQKLAKDLQEIAREAAIRDLVKDAAALHVLARFAQEEQPSLFDRVNDSYQTGDNVATVVKHIAPKINPATAVADTALADGAATGVADGVATGVGDAVATDALVGGGEALAAGAGAEAAGAGLASMIPGVGWAIAGGLGARALYDWWSNRNKPDEHPAKQATQDPYKLAQLVVTLRQMASQKPDDLAVKTYLANAEHDLVEARKEQQAKAA
jgi:hypothetical protein